MNFRWPGLAVMLTLGSGCLKMEIVEPLAEISPTFVVMALLSPDQGGIVEVGIQRVLPVNAPQWEEGPLRVPRSRVTDAVVSLSEKETDLDYVLVYDETKSPLGAAAVYVPLDTTFIPRGGVTYHLDVRTCDEQRITGSTTVPLTAQIHRASVPDTVELNNPAVISWQPSSGYYVIDAVVADSVYYRRSSLTGGELVYADTTAVIDISFNDFYFYYLATDSASFFVLIHFNAVDANLFNYFGHGGNPLEIQTSLVLGVDPEAPAFGISGGLGVMGSLRYDRLAIPFIR